MWSASRRYSPVPAEVFDGDVSGVAGGLGLGADDFVLAVGLIPGGADVDAEFFGGDKGLELGVGAVGEAIADAEGDTLGQVFMSVIDVLVFEFFW